MATRGEDFRAEEQRKAQKPKKKAKAKHTHKKSEPILKKEGRIGKKVSYAEETTPAAGEPPSRKSTRKSANRAKPDSQLNRREEMRKTSPDARARKSRANGTKVRGSGGKKI